MQFPYSKPPGFAKLHGGLPLLDIELSSAGGSIPVKALVDSGSSMNILPYDLGLALGLVWEDQSIPVDVGGALPDTQAYGVLLRGKIEGFEAFCPGLCLGLEAQPKGPDDFRPVKFFPTLPR